MEPEVTIDTNIPSPISPEASVRTDASSPPPFDVLAASQREDLPRPGGLGDRLRQVGTALSALRGISLASMDDRPVSGESRSNRASRSFSSAPSEGDAGEIEEAVTEGATPPPEDMGPKPTFRDRFRQIGTALTMLRTFSSSSGDERQGMVGAATADRADFRLGIGRSMRAYNLFEEIRVDYQRNLQPLAPESREWEATMLALHRRSAKKCLELARANGGLYIKVAVPHEFRAPKMRAQSRTLGAGHPAALCSLLAARCSLGAAR